MMNEGDRVKQAVKEALSDLKEKAPLPGYDTEDFISAKHREGKTAGWQEFSENFSIVNGRPINGVEELAVYLKEEGYEFGYCDPSLREKVGKGLEEEDLDLSYEFERVKVDDYAFGITRASGVIAESGTVILNDEDTVDRLAALAPWVHVAVIDDEPIFETIPEAIENLGDSSNVIWVTGPSKTADIEGILIEGVHGPGIQICLKVG
jgi:L-lactate dehydrogenase complex protein LldG